MATKIRKKKILPTAPPYRYIRPDSLSGVFTRHEYSRYLDGKACSVRRLDRRRKSPLAKLFSNADYARAIHAAIVTGCLRDPYTGELLRWDLIHKWPVRKQNGTTVFGRHLLEQGFALFPSIDHKDLTAEVLDFEVCAWRTNACKSYLTPQEFIAFCKMVAAYANQ